MEIVVGSSSSRSSGRSSSSGGVIVVVVEVVVVLVVVLIVVWLYWMINWYGQVPYWEAIQNATSKLDHVTASVRAHEYMPLEDDALSLARGHIAMKGRVDTLLAIIFSLVFSPLSY